MEYALKRRVIFNWPSGALPVEFSLINTRMVPFRKQLVTFGATLLLKQPVFLDCACTIIGTDREVLLSCFLIAAIKISLRSPVGGSKGR